MRKAPRSKHLSMAAGSAVLPPPFSLTIVSFPSIYRKPLPLTLFTEAMADALAKQGTVGYYRFTDIFFEW